MESLTVPEIALNKNGLYEGELTHYLKVIFDHAENIGNPYHNLRHMLHVFWSTYDACIYYKDKLPPGEMRVLLIAALFHDFNHTGKTGDDSLNIEGAIKGLERHILKGDRKDLGQISDLIRVTEYPYKKNGEELELMQRILRDADLSQTWSHVWLQQVVVGLSRERGSSIKDFFREQEGYLKGFSFLTKWGEERFGKMRGRKVEEIRAWLEVFK